MEGGQDAPGVETSCHMAPIEEESSEEMTAARTWP